MTIVLLAAQEAQRRHSPAGERRQPAIPHAQSCWVTLEQVRYMPEQAIYTVNSFRFTRSTGLSWRTDREGGVA
jgi:hypothetical protein